MKMDFRHLGLVLLFCGLAACGKQRTASNTFEKAGEECATDVLPRQFVVKYFDGRLERVEAASKEEFINGFLTEHLDQIEFAEHDFRVRLSQAAPVTVRSGSVDNWGAIRVNATALWQQNIRGSGVIVAVIDTGIDLNHPKLRTQLATNTNEIAGNDIDDDHNGYVDDVIGYDFAKNKVLEGDYTGHGTHVAGVIAAAHNDTQAQSASYVQGLAPDAKILPLAFLDEKGSGSMLNGVYAIRYAIQRGAKVINASWGGPSCSRSLKEAIAGLEAQGVIFVAAAGNDSLNIDRTPAYPAALDMPAQIVVGATGDHDHMAEYSNYGRQHVHLFAPGSDIISTYPEGRLASLSGTSMATPFVVGAIALLLSAEPTANVAKIRQALYASATKRTEYLNASQGRMNLTTALTALRQ